MPAAQAEPAVGKAAVEPVAPAKRASAPKAGKAAKAAAKATPEAATGETAAEPAAPAKRGKAAKGRGTAKPKAKAPKAAKTAKAARPAEPPQSAEPTPDELTAAREKAEFEQWYREEGAVDVEGGKTPMGPQRKLVAVRVEGGGAARKGTYWEEGSAQFDRAAKSEKYVVMPESEAQALKFRPNGAAHDINIKPHQVDGVQVESSGAGAGKGNKHNVTGRAAVKPDGAGGFDNAIGASRAEAHGYKLNLQQGELGIMRPGNASTGGVDSITAEVGGGKAKIFLNDYTTPNVSKGAKPQHASWLEELNTALDDPAFGFGGRKDAGALAEALRDKATREIYVRITRLKFGSNGVVSEVEELIRIAETGAPK